MDVAGVWNRWAVATAIAAMIIFVESVKWTIIDSSPTGWDQSGYLLQSTIFHDVLLKDGFFAFVHKIVTYDPGRVILMPTIVQPSFLFFGATLDVAMITLYLFWLLMAWSIYGIADILLPGGIGKRGGFFAFLMFALWPMTINLSNSFLVEFSLVSLVCAFNYSIIRYWACEKRVWLYLSGIFCAMGSLDKVTFVVFCLSYGCIAVCKIRQGRTRSALIDLTIFLSINIGLAAPYYVYNFRHIIASTKFLSSRKLADLYQFGEVFDVETILNYWKALFTGINMNICLLLAVVFVLLTLKEARISRPQVNSIFPVFLLMAWFIPPFFLGTFGTIKDVRYVYPALVPFFILGGVGLSMLMKFRVGLIVALFVISLPIAQFLISNCIIERAYWPLSKIPYANRPDPRDWKSDNLVKAINSELETKHMDKSVIFLGGSMHHNINQIKYQAYKNSLNLNFSILPYYEVNDLDLEKSINFIDTTKHSSILYRQGPNDPDFITKYDIEIIERMKNSGKYQQVELGIVQPDKSTFIFLVKKIEGRKDLHGKS